MVGAAPREPGSYGLTTTRVLGCRAYRFAAAAWSSSHTVESRPTAPAAGTSSADAPPIAAATASAFSDPETTNHTSRDRITAGSVRVIRTGGGLGSL